MTVFIASYNKKNHFFGEWGKVCVWLIFSILWQSVFLKSSLRPIENAKLLFDQKWVKFYCENGVKTVGCFLIISSKSVACLPPSFLILLYFLRHTRIGAKVIAILPLSCYCANIVWRTKNGQRLQLYSKKRGFMRRKQCLLFLCFEV